MITGKQRVARKKNIAIARMAKKKKKKSPSLKTMMDNIRKNGGKMATTDINKVSPTRRRAMLRGKLSSGMIRRALQ